MRDHFEWKPGRAVPYMPERVHAPPSEPLGDYAIVLHIRDVRTEARWVFGNALVCVASSEVDVWAGALAIQRLIATAGIADGSAPPRFRIEPARVQPGDRFLASLHSDEPRVASTPRREGVFGKRELRFSVGDAAQPLPRWLSIAVSGDGPIALL